MLHKLTKFWRQLYGPLPLKHFSNLKIKFFPIVKRIVAHAKAQKIQNKAVLAYLS